MSTSVNQIATSSPRRHRFLGIGNLGVLPFAFALPFIHYPKLIDGDTQIWIFLAGLIAALIYKTNRFILNKDIPIFVLAGLCLLAYATRAPLDSELLRIAYMHLAFVVFWVITRREEGDVFPVAVRITIICWLIVGLYQSLSLNMGLAVEIPGRFVEGRGGVPGLTAEPSAYGTMSVLHIMYLLNEPESKYKKWFITAALISVMLSGSILSFALLVFPLMRLPLLKQIALLGVGVMLITMDSMYKFVGVSNRLESFLQDSWGSSFSLLDASLNLRLGHIHFTLLDQLIPSLSLLTSVSFMEQYNAFTVMHSGYIYTESNFILPALGEMVYCSGPFGLALLVFVLIAAANTSSRRPIEKVVFLLACLLNPIPLSNPFLIMYTLQRDSKDNAR